MDFDIAAKRLEKDQQSALARSLASRNARTASDKSKREAAAHRAQAQKRLQEKRFDEQRRALLHNEVMRVLGLVERTLGVVNVRSVGGPGEEVGSKSMGTAADLLQGGGPLACGWRLDATSIHGEGDKITLSPSILETLTSGSYPDLDPWGGSSNNSRPLAFRIGVLNPDYSGFPSSDKMKSLIDAMKNDIDTNVDIKVSISDESDGPPPHDAQEMDVSDDEGDLAPSIREAYLDELSHRYLSYTHGTVVEFTQDDGYVGLPETIAHALLCPNSYSLVGSRRIDGSSRTPAKRTVDPASASSMNEGGAADEPVYEKYAHINTKSVPDSADTEKTPGHPAYGMFDIPAVPIEITPIKSLHPGKECTFTPTATSIQRGFYDLKDVKLVLEQSIMRTRATLSRGDVIRTWRRGVSFDLIVSSVSPMEYGVVSCVNTDLNVDIGPPEGTQDETTDKGVDGAKCDDSVDQSTGQGRLLSEQMYPATEAIVPRIMSSVVSNSIELPPEPAEDEIDGVCTVQIRGDGSIGKGRRRFYVGTATMADLFNFASEVAGDGVGGVGAFSLVTRFPRRVYRLLPGDADMSGGEGFFRADDTFDCAGIQGQVLFMIEKI